MARDAVAGRYAQALFDSAKAEQQLEPALKQLEEVARLLDGVPDLRQLLLNPDVEPEDKLRVLDVALRGRWSPPLRAFTELVVRASRAEFLGGMAEALRDLVDADQGRMRAVVTSAHPLAEAELSRLREALERREGKRIELDAEVDPELIGGLRVRLDHRVIDGSVQRQLADLRERLRALRVA